MGVEKGSAVDVAAISKIAQPGCGSIAGCNLHARALMHCMLPHLTFPQTPPNSRIFFGLTIAVGSPFGVPSNPSIFFRFTRSLNKAYISYAIYLLTSKSFVFPSLAHFFSRSLMGNVEFSKHDCFMKHTRVVIYVSAGIFLKKPG